MINTIGSVNIYYLVDAIQRKEKKIFFPCDESLGFTLLITFPCHTAVLASHHIIHYILVHSYN